MKLKSLTLQNFRCFEHLEIDLHPQLTVLIGENSIGKTAVLDAIRGILVPFLQGITNNNNNNTTKNNIEYINQERDIRRCQKGDWNMVNHSSMP